MVMSFNATPSFADNLWDACHKLRVDRGISATQDTGNRHIYARFMHQCLSGQIPLASGAPVSASARGHARPPARPVAARRSATTTASGDTPLLTVPSSQAKTPPLAECFGRGIVLFAAIVPRAREQSAGRGWEGSPLHTKLTT